MHFAPTNGPAASTVDLTALQTQVYSLLSNSFEHAVDNITAEAKERCALRVAEAAIPGLRQQILANVDLLVPYLKANHTAPAAVNKESSAVQYHVQLITVGVEPTIRACIFSGGAAVPKKLIHSDASTNTPEALNNLLKKTEKMIGTQLFPDSKATSKATTAVTRNDSGVDLPDMLDKAERTKEYQTAFWDADAVNNSRFRRAYDRDVRAAAAGSDSGFESEGSGDSDSEDLALVRAAASTATEESGGEWF